MPAARGMWPYTAPEQTPLTTDVPAVSASRRTDMYAFGTLAWEVLSGAQPWSDASAGQRLRLLLQNESLNLRSLPADSLRAIVELTRHCLSSLSALQWTQLFPLFVKPAPH